VSGPDSGQFRALEAEVAAMQEALKILGQAVAVILPVPEPERPRLRLIEGGDGKPN
jgi:hypothetical protein